MRSKLPLIARLILGFIFFVFGLIGLLNLMPPPADIPQDMADFMKGLMATGYFMPLLKGTETVCGALLLAGIFVPLALIVLAPIVLNILLVHIFMSPEGLPVAIVVSLLEIYLAFYAKPYSDIVKQIFRCPKLEAKK